MISRRALAKAYVQLMDNYSTEQLSAAMAPLIAENKLDIDLLAKDISAEVLAKKDILTGTLTVAHRPTEQTVAGIQTRLQSLAGARQSNLDVVVDADIIGGFLAETAVGTIDSSVITMLDKLEVA